ncbi:MAG: hypothetical protein V4471_03095 [Pseudomonadota bacterium]
MFQNRYTNPQQVIASLEEMILSNHLLIQQFNELFQQTLVLLEENGRLRREISSQIHNLSNLHQDYNNLYRIMLTLDQTIINKTAKIHELERFISELKEQTSALETQLAKTRLNQANNSHPATTTSGDNTSTSFFQPIPSTSQQTTNPIDLRRPTR